MKKYWKSTEELNDSNHKSQGIKEKDAEFSVEGLSDQEVKQGVKTNRRDFLKVLGFSVGYAAVAASCEQPVKKAIPYLAKPEEITPGVANHYATTFFDGQDFASVLVKVREGRPIKVEGNELSSITEGGTSARIQASVLDLYDGNRQQFPLKNGQKASWNNIDSEISDKLDQLSQEGKSIVLLSSSVISPSTLKLFDAFKEKYPTTEVVYYDAIGYDAMVEANRLGFGRETIASYHFDKAELIVGLNCDFLGGWLSPVEFAAQYAKTRNLSEDRKTLSKHYQFETNMTLTGSNADERIPVKPSDEKVILLNIYNQIASKNGMMTLNAPEPAVNVDKVVKDLMNHQGKGLVVSGTNDVYIQLLVNAINFLLSNLGVTFEFERSLQTKKGNAKQFAQLIDELNEGKVGGILIHNVNPVYDYFEGIRFAEGLKKTSLSLAMSTYNDETASLADYMCPLNHYLESWDDAEIYSGFYSLTQPAIRKIFDTRQMQENLLLWSGKEVSWHDYIQQYWENTVFPNQTEHLIFRDFWNNTLQKGVYETGPENLECPVFDFDYLASIATPLSNIDQSTGIAFLLYEKIGIGSGKQANNPWLQELPDPITKAVWDNYVTVSPRFASDNGWKQEDVVELEGIKLPVLIQPGQAYGTVGIALGYGRTNGGKIANGLGVNVFSLCSMKNNSIQLSGNNIGITATGEKYSLATTQTHHTMEGRQIVRETTLEEYKHDPADGNEAHALAMGKMKTMYPEHDMPGAHWAMSVDLNTCTGCNACVIACQVENNIAVIGKEEVKNRRIMHWLRIDRYYSSGHDESEPETDNPEVFHQPVMCQHCDNAPCENVCPVAATPHTKEGLNSMAYNRCIGTRYCMNNCPYRVRRFNWYRFLDNDKYDYNMNSELGKMVLNPDVVVRERGVVEKCSFCVQRIQDKKLVAKNEGRPLRDGEIKTACVQACPTKAITFGDAHLKSSVVNKKFDDPRAYGLLEELHTLPSVAYLTKVRNKAAEHKDEDHH